MSARPPLLFRCSSLGRIMGEPKTIDEHLRTPEVQEIIDKRKRTPEEAALIASLKAQSLSEAARTYIRDLATEGVFNVEVEHDARILEKGRQVEPQIIALVNQLRGLNLAKNTRRLEDEFITGEADCVDLERDEGHDAKAAWSLATFPLCAADIEGASTFQNYVWQMRGYMRLWKVSRWHIQYGLVDTPEDLLGRDDQIALHLVSHIPAHLRLTTYTIERDLELEALIPIKVQAARRYYESIVSEFYRTHPEPVAGQLISLPPPRLIVPEPEAIARPPAASPEPAPAPKAAAKPKAAPKAEALVSNPF